MLGAAPGSDVRHVARQEAEGEVKGAQGAQVPPYK